MKKFLLLALATSMCLAVSQKSFATNPATAEYTVDIPAAVNMTLTASTDFGTITSSQFGTDNTAEHTILLGNGTVAGSTSFVETNDTATATDLNYTIVVAPATGATATTIAADGPIAKLTLANGAAASVDIRLKASGASTLPKLGGIPFAISGTDTLNIPVSSSVAFDGSKAPLDMLMDLNEASLGMDDATGLMGFTLTFTAVGI
jgi:hypothetical protein